KTPRRRSGSTKVQANGPPPPPWQHRDPHPTDRRRGPTPRTGLPPGHRPQAPGPPPDRPAGPPGPAPPGHRRRPGPHPAHRPALAQRLPRRRDRRREAPSGEGARPGDPGPPGGGEPPLGDRGPGRAGAGPGQLDPRRAGRSLEEDPRHHSQSLGHAAVLPSARHPPLSPDLPPSPGR